MGRKLVKPRPSKGKETHGTQLKLLKPKPKPLDDVEEGQDADMSSTMLQSESQSQSALDTEQPTDCGTSTIA